jgi:hypothetical protein
MGTRSVIAVQDGDGWGTEFCYVLHSDGVEVFERRWNDSGHMVGMLGVGAAEGKACWEPKGFAHDLDSMILRGS